MSESNGETPASNGNGATAGAEQRQFAMQQIYVKDLSFEAPNVPEVFSAPGANDPDVKLNLKNSHRSVGDDIYEAKLHISVHAKVGEETMFLAEVEQAGLFLVKGFAEDDARKILGIHCPGTLFPYVRETVSSLVVKGGFPPLVLQPINFEAVYAQTAEQAGAAQA